MSPIQQRLERDLARVNSLAAVRSGFPDYSALNLRRAGIIRDLAELRQLTVKETQCLAQAKEQTR